MYIISIDVGDDGGISIMSSITGEVLSTSLMPNRYLMKRVKRKPQSKYLKDGVTLRKKRPPLKQDKRTVLDASKLRDFILPYKDEVEFCVIEYVTSMTGQGVKSSFKFGGYFMAVMAVLETLNINFHMVRPQEWQKHFGLIKPKSKNRVEGNGIKEDEQNETDRKDFKNKIRSPEDEAYRKEKKLNIAKHCLELYPYLNLYTPQGRLLDGISDSVLIGRYAFENRGLMRTIGAKPFDDE